VIAAAFLLAGSVFILIGGHATAEEWRLARNGVSTDAIILTKEVRNLAYRPMRYEATYRFMVPEGAFEHRARLSYETWGRLKERDLVEVRYLPQQPATSRLTGAQRRTSPSSMALLGCACLVTGAGLRRRRRVERRF
jgi:hypothetical protein